MDGWTGSGSALTPGDHKTNLDSLLHHWLFRQTQQCDVAIISLTITPK